MTDLPEFGHRRPQRLPDMQPDPADALKRSRHVKLLVMGAFVVGAFGWGWMEHQNCQVAPGVAAPATPQTTTSCTSRGWSSGSGGHGRYSLFGGGSSGGVSTGGSESASSGVSRGGFGGFGRAFGFSGG